ncbi:MAG: hypothetical protein WCH01_14430 [Methylococcaceae bacterium]
MRNIKGGTINEGQNHGYCTGLLYDSSLTLPRSSASPENMVDTGTTHSNRLSGYRHLSCSAEPTPLVTHDTAFGITPTSAIALLLTIKKMRKGEVSWKKS